MYRLQDRFLGRLIDRYLGRLLDRSVCRLLGRVPYHPPKGFLARLFSRFAFASLAALVTPLSSAARPPSPLRWPPGSGFSRVCARDTGTACTSTALWNLTAHGNKAFSPQTDGSAVCRYAYWSMKWLYLQMARSQSVVWFPPHSPDTRSPGPRDSLIFKWDILLDHNTL